MKAVFISLAFLCSFQLNVGWTQGIFSPWNKPVDDSTSVQVTTITFQNTEFDFGEVNLGDTIHYTFIFTNSGEEDLIIQTVKPSCSCTKINWPENPVLPSSSGEINVSYSTTEKSPGENEVHLTLLYNGIPNLEILTLKMRILDPGKLEDKKQ